LRQASLIEIRQQKQSTGKSILVRLQVADFIAKIVDVNFLLNLLSRLQGLDRMQAKERQVSSVWRRHPLPTDRRHDEKCEVVFRKACPQA
jgi:hypothetical protein